MSVPPLDPQLLQRVAQGDARAFRELSQQLLGPIVNYAYRILGNRAEAEDVAQETFLRAWQKADSYRPTARVSTWMFAIAHNLCIDGLRKRRGGTWELDDERDEAPSSNNPAELLERKARAQDVRQALDSLPERQKMAILLSHEQGLSNPEIAQVLDLGVEAVESLLSRGRRKLRESLGGTEES
ncbi:MAG TPA: sigma-70 family RNA polymerase sigma factor [Polyangiaceae bacterium]|nr:sigma-70 family RNA polymerase sigma factor [Polyangiaceae bacterium]